MLKWSEATHGDQFRGDLKRNLQRNVGFDAVMRLRCSTSDSIDFKNIYWCSVLQWHFVYHLIFKMGGIFSMSSALDKEKSESLTGIECTTFCTPVGRSSHWAGSYLLGLLWFCVLYAARGSNVERVQCDDKERKMVNFKLVEDTRKMEYSVCHKLGTK